MSKMYSCPNCGASVVSDDLFCQTCGIDLMKNKSSEFSKPLNRSNEYRGYIQIIGNVEVVFGIITLVFGLIVSIVAIFAPLFILQDMTTDDLGSSTELVAIFVGSLIFIIALMLLIFGIAQIIYARRLLQYRSSGRIGTMVIGVLQLFSVPLGTVFGIAALYILTRPEAIDLFND